MNIYDLENIQKYQLSKYLHKNTDMKTSFSHLYQYILRTIPKSKIIVIGGSDEICKSVYDS